MLKETHSVRSFWLIVSLAVATAVLHGVFGAYYAIHAENLTSKPTLQMEGMEYLESFPGWDAVWENDAAAYNRAALGVLRTGVPRNRAGGVSVHALVFDYFLAACYWVGGVRLYSVVIAQALLAGLTCLFVGLTTSRIAPPSAPWAGCLGAAIMLSNLRLAVYVGNPQATILLLFLFSIMLYAAAGPRTLANRALFATVVGLAIFTQAAFFVVAAAGAVWLALESFRHREAAARYGCVCIIVLIGCRLALPLINFGGNAKEDGWRKTDSGGVLWEANNPYYESMRLTTLWERRPGNSWTHWHMSEQEERRYGQYYERAHRDGGRAAILWIRENPAQYAKLCFIRLRAELGPFTGQMSPHNRLISTFYWLLIFPAGLFGLWQSRDLGLAWLIGLVILAIFTFDTLVIVEWYLRYRLPVDVALTVCAGMAYGGNGVGTLLGLRVRGLESRI